MKVLIACEYSGIVRSAFEKRGHNAWSCDILPTEIPGNHIQDDVLKHLDKEWDLMIAHPPCTHLAVSGARHFKKKQKEQKKALNFVKNLLGANIKKIALENPVSVISSKIRKPDQIIQPYQFGHDAKKTTCLWLKNLPKLYPTNEIKITPDIVLSSGKKMSFFYYQTGLLPLRQRWKARSEFWSGIAEAMAEQWS